MIMDTPYAIVGSDNKALNFITWNGVNEFDYGQADGNYLVSLDGIESYGFGWLYDAAANAFVAPIPPEPEPVVPEHITRRQCAMQLFTLNMITSEEAISMTQTGTPPASVMAYIDTLEEPQRTMAIMDFAATNYYRDNPLLAALMTANGMTDAQVDKFFIAASAL